MALISNSTKIQGSKNPKILRSKVPKVQRSQGPKIPRSKDLTKTFIAMSLCHTLFLGNWSRNFFDATMTYRRDADIFNALYQIVPTVPMTPLDIQGRWRIPDLSKENIQNLKDSLRELIIFITYMVHKEILIARKILFITPLRVSGVRERDGCLGVRGLLGGAWVGAGGGAVCEGCWGWLG